MASPDPDISPPPSHRSGADSFLVRGKTLPALPSSARDLSGLKVFCGDLELLFLMLLSPNYCGEVCAIISGLCGIGSSSPGCVTSPDYIPSLIQTLTVCGHP